MNNRVFKYLLISFISISGLLGFTACGDDKHYYEIGADMETYIFNVDYDQWRWNSYDQRYEYSYTFPEFDKYMFDAGAVQGWVYIWKTDGNNDYQVLTQCPYVQTYPNGTAAPYSETIGFDLYLNPTKKIVFYVQASDLSDVDSYLDDYSFKVNFIYKK
jgi:hypothetical protein